MTLNLPAQTDRARDRYASQKGIGTAKREKRRGDRLESHVEQRVRALVVARDGDCRLAGVTLCRGESEFAHLENKRRWNTRNLPPDVRHTPAGTAMLCTLHHAQYDRHAIVIVSLPANGADGDLTWDVPGYGVYVERRRA